ncbi:MAG: hypothetical protein VXY16_11135 [Pseudomonadota bacterium]|nr:hypothetical protein [Pseudomonadota bacterium]
MAEKNNGQTIVAHYLNDLLTTDYDAVYEMTDVYSQRTTKVCYIGFDPDYILEHRKVIETTRETLVALLEYFVPSFFKTDFDWFVSLMGGNCVLFVKGLDKHHNYRLKKDEAPYAIAYARKQMRLIDGRFGQSVDMTLPEALKLIEAAKAKSPQQADALYKKKTIITELRKLKTFSGPKAPVIDFPLRKS